MRFVGIDFGWVSGASGLALLEGDDKRVVLRATDLRVAVDDVAAWVDDAVGNGPAVIGVDAPLVIVNATGMREVDRLTHVHYGRYDAGCYPANLGRPFAARTASLARALLERGFAHGPTMPPRNRGRWQIEVYPHASSVELFALDRIVKYKRGLLAERRRELRRYRSLIGRLDAYAPRLDGGRGVRPPLTIPARGPALKAVEDQLDAILCAYTAAHFWAWGQARNVVLGEAATGYLVVPHRYDASAPRPDSQATNARANRRSR